MDRVVVRAPATIANLGPGFDCLGLAIAWHNEIRIERDPSGALTVTTAGQGADQVPRDDSNLAVRAIAKILGEPRGLRVHLTNAIPFGRGFGSSAAAIVGGLVAASALAPDAEVWDADVLVAIAAEMEGHADNIAPCVYGGAVVAAGRTMMPLGVPERIGAVVCVAPSALATQAARKLLPSSVPLADASATAGRAALLAASLATDDPSRLLDATYDLMHQPSRFELMPDSGRLVGALRDAGIAAFLAGAGPSVAALVASSDLQAATEAARRTAPDGWEVREVGIDAAGAVVVESG
ncbi:MAG: homoserine kinase [Actinomycetota bacterium]